MLVVLPEFESPERCEAIIGAARGARAVRELPTLREVAARDLAQWRSAPPAAIARAAPPPAGFLMRRASASSTAITARALGTTFFDSEETIRDSEQAFEEMAPVRVSWARPRRGASADLPQPYTLNDFFSIFLTSLLFWSVAPVASARRPAREPGNVIHCRPGSSSVNRYL
jgi:hypothetical protein